MQNNEQQVHNSMQVSFYQSTLDCTLSGEFCSNGWRFNMWHKEKREFLFEGFTLQQFMEIILLGKLTKDKLIQTSEEKV